MQKLFTSVAVIAGIVLASGAYAQDAAKESQPPNELIQYIRDARKAGVKDKQIQQNALNAGWPADVVTNALKTGTPKSSRAPVTAAKSNDAPPAGPSAESSAAKLPADKAVSPDPKPSKTEAPAPASATPAVAASVTVAAPEAAKTPAVVDRGVPDNYEIGAGDELQISVWKEPDASVGGVVVRPDGKITMPMLKEVSVIGLTPTQVEKVITEQLVKFIAAADVTVIVRAINSKKIYVVGGVKKEGPINYVYRMTIMQAISEAGGLSDYAKKKKIYVLRHENGRDYRIPFDYDAALKGEKMELNIPMMPGDTLVVPK
jgi:polysaccharide export outer membrane protein